jgi:hypothetical protein
LKKEDENSRPRELRGRAKAERNKKRKVKAIRSKITRTMTKDLVAEQHDSIQAQDKKVIELEEFDEQPNSVKRTTTNKKLRPESFLSPSPSFKLPANDSEELDREFNQFMIDYETTKIDKEPVIDPVSTSLKMWQVGKIEKLKEELRS